MNTGFKHGQAFAIVLLLLGLGVAKDILAQEALDRGLLKLQVGAATKLGAKPMAENSLEWKSSAPQIVEVFRNGFVVGLKPGQARVEAQGAPARDTQEWLITVEGADHSLVNPALLKQYPDDREFMVGHRKCYGSELNGRRASDPAERRFLRSNRVVNPKPLREDKPLDWALQPGTEVYDGAGMWLGTVPATLKIDNHRVPVSMFNFGASKVLRDRICVYAFAVSIKPSPAVAKLVDPSELNAGAVGVSAWLPLDSVINKEALLERIGLGQAKLPALPLEATGYRVTGGNPKLYMTEFGELSIVRQVETGPVPSHYLRRPSGTVNLIYSVPGFGLGGQGVDSFLVSDGLEFFPAEGAKVFHQPTYFPSKDPRAGKVSSQTMTFLYGAIKAKGTEPIYGWIAREALATPHE